MTLHTELNSWQATLIPIGSTIQDAIKSLETSRLQIVLVVCEGNKLIGTVTDGDIRRAFLSGLSLESSIQKIIYKNPLVVPQSTTRDFVLKLMHANKVRQVPVVDSEGVVVGLNVWNDVITPKLVDNTMIIMAGGRGTRLHPLTENCPKPMLEISGKPILEHIIERGKSDGFHNFIISLHYLGEMIEDHFGDGRNLGISIAYLREESPLGTAGCLSLLKHRPPSPFLVTNGDVLTDVHYDDILDFHLSHNATATMAVRQHEIQNQFGVVRTKGLEIEAFEEKPIYRSHINAGIYVLSPDVLSHLKFKQYCDMPLLFEFAKQNGERTIVYPMYEPWLDVGKPADLEFAQKNCRNI